jgi:hypothetical protein
MTPFEVVEIDGPVFFQLIELLGWKGDGVGQITQLVVIPFSGPASDKTRLFGGWAGRDVRPRVVTCVHVWAGTRIEVVGGTVATCSKCGASACPELTNPQRPATPGRDDKDTTHRKENN